MGIGWQVLGAGVSNSLETASQHSYCKLQETSKKTTELLHPVLCSIQPNASAAALTVFFQCTVRPLSAQGICC